MARKRIRSTADMDIALEELKQHIDKIEEAVPNQESLTAADWQKLLVLLMKLAEMAVQIATAAGAGARG